MAAKLTEKFRKQTQAVKIADAGPEENFQAELKKMRRLQQQIEARLAEAQAIVNELEPIIASNEWDGMAYWVRKYTK